MDFKYGEIEIAPKNISWVGMPIYMSDRDRFELLKRDIFIHECEPKYLTGLKAVQNRDAACVFNLDKILQENKKSKILGSTPISTELAKFIRGNNLRDSFVHTTLIDDKVCSIFKDFNIPLIQRDLQFRQNAWQYINDKVMPTLFKERAPREFVRLKFYPHRTILVGITNLTQVTRPRTTAVLKDLSLNGIGITLKEKSLLKNFELGDFIQVTVISNDVTLTIATAFLTRLDENEREIGAKFNINDELFISRHDAHQLMRIVYSTIKELTNNTIKNNQSKEKYNIL